MKARHGTRCSYLHPRKHTVHTRDTHSTAFAPEQRLVFTSCRVLVEPFAFEMFDHLASSSCTHVFYGNKLDCFKARAGSRLMRFYPGGLHFVLSTPARDCCFVMLLPCSSSCCQRYGYMARVGGVCMAYDGSTGSAVCLVCGYGLTLACLQSPP